MNKNHFDIQTVCSKKITRLEASLLDISQAEKILDDLPDDLVQKIWIKTIESNPSHGKDKTKLISKGLYKRSLRKTLETIKVFIDLI